MATLEEAEIDRLNAELDLERRRLKTSEELRAGLVAVIHKQWQPIETAPKDEGTEILAACYFDDGSCQVQVAQWWVESWAMVGKLSMIVLDPQPTYWTPIREPPPCP